MPLQPRTEPPGVWTWYRVYAALMAVMYLVLVALGFLMPFVDDRARQADMPSWLMPLVMGVICGPLAAAYVAAFLVPLKPWAWVYHLVLICVGMTSACCIPACVPLLIFWIKPETKLFFGRA